MAARRYFYTGEDDTVRCFEFNVEICEWVEGDHPLGGHQRWQGFCEFIRKIPCGYRRRLNLGHAQWLGRM